MVGQLLPASEERSRAPSDRIGCVDANKAPGTARKKEKTTTVEFERRKDNV